LLSAVSTQAFRIQLLKYVLVNCPQLVYFELNCLNTHYEVKLSRHNYRPYQTVNNDAQVEVVGFRRICAHSEIFGLGIYTLV
jgi:transcriptional antiterminator Rof (Rho-off)